METATERLLLQLKTLADPVRMRLVALCRHGECSVAELTEVTGQSQPRVSQHLKKLCEAGLLERFRDGKRVYYRIPAPRGSALARRALLELIPATDATMQADALRLHQIRGDDRPGRAQPQAMVAEADRAIHRALLDLTVTAPIGDLLDIGCGRGRMLKLLASRAHRAVGVDIDATARQLARAELMLAGLPNCSLRQGDMHRLPFEDREFDTIILDDVLGESGQPVRALVEAKRLLRPGGRLFLLQRVRDQSAAQLQKALAQWSASAGLRLGPPRFVPGKASGRAPEWLLCVAIAVDADREAA
jgi:SAM-dependent methyltransferase